MTSILYVACSRVNELKNLFVSPIHPAIWKQLGNSESDNLRRLHEQELKKSSYQFARRSSEQISANQVDFLKQYEWEHTDDIRPGLSEALEHEWNEIRTRNSPPTDARILDSTSLDNSARCNPRDHPHSPSWIKPVRYDVLGNGVLLFETTLVIFSFHIMSPCFFSLSFQFANA